MAGRKGCRAGRCGSVQRPGPVVAGPVVMAQRCGDALLFLRGLVSGATRISPSSAQALRNSPFSVTLAWVQVRPERYQTTGSLAPAGFTGPLS